MKSERRGIALAAATACLFAGANALAAPPADSDFNDLLRFHNRKDNDSLHGEFLGMPEAGVLRWQHSDAREAIVFETENLRYLSLNGGRALRALHSPSFVLLHSGDRIPGTLIALDDERLTLKTDVAGTLVVPRQFVRQIAPNPHGGAIHYVGPYAAGDWTIVEPSDEEAVPGEDAEPAPDPDAEDHEEEGNEEQLDSDEDEGPWVFMGGAYYSKNQLPIAVDAHAPDVARIAFTLAWRNRLNAAIAFHATMEEPADEADEAKPEPQGDNGGQAGGDAPARGIVRHGSDSTRFAATYGSSYVLTIYSNYAQLYRCTFNEDGEPEVDRLATSSSNLRLDEAGEADFELRCDRHEGTIMLFADGRYISQWEDLQGYAGTGSHLAFACQSSSSRLRVSDVVVSSWNGMLDSASSMEVEDRDIVLLTNGMDRFAGEVRSFADGSFRVEGTYAEMQIPITEVQEIRLAKAGETEDPEGSREAIRVLLEPFGRLTVTPLEATAELLKARHPALGELEIDLRYSGLIEFSFGDSVLDSWDDDF